MNQEELSRYIDKLASESSLPLFLYNAPQYTKTEIEPATVKNLAKHENIIGIKDSSGNMSYLKKLLNDKMSNDFTIMVGPEEFLGECILLGCNGGVNGGSNMFPKLYVNMYRAAIRKDMDEMKKWQNLIIKVQQRVYNLADSPMGIIIGLKYVLSIKDICSPRMAMPVYRELTDGQKKTMEDLVREFDRNGL
jgi:4-hydroxy-tetrahydrodipicolinate synthase